MISEGYSSIRLPGATRSGYRPDVDGLRALAIAMVIAYHGFPAMRTGGFLGVDVFFVISGYLITRLTLDGLSRGSFSLGDFYRRRVRRIVPALLVVSVACGIAGWLFLLPSELRWLGQALGWSAPFLANAFFARMGGYFDRAVDFNPLLHLWSLGVEEQFYIVWPVMLLAAARYGVTSRVLTAVTLTSLAISVWGASNGPRAHFYLPGSRAWELAAGGVLAQWEMRRAAGRPAGLKFEVPANLLTHLASCLGLAFVLAGGLLWTASKPVPGAWSLLPVTGALLMIGAGPQALPNRWFFMNRPMVWIGKISYPLYLWHWPLFSFTRIFLGRAPPPLLSAAETLLAVGAAWITFAVLERPVRRGQFGAKAVPVLLTLLASLALVGSAVAMGWIPGRLTGSVFAVWDAAATDWSHPAGAGDEDLRKFSAFNLSSERDRKVLFVGDSHSQQYWPRVARVIETHHDAARSAIFASYFGCPPLPGIVDASRQRDCAELFALAMQRALEPDVDTVVFTAFWEKYFVGEFAVQDSRAPICRAQARTCAPLELDSPEGQIVFSEFQGALQRLVASGRRVFIVLSNPTSPQFIPLFPWRLRLWQPGALASSGEPYVDARAFEAFVAPIANRLREVARASGAAVLDPGVTFCPGGICRATGTDGLPLYLDSNHLRGGFARQRATFIDQAVLDAGSD